MATLCFVQPVSDADEIQVHASARPGNTKASTDWGIRAFGVSGLQAELPLMHIARELFWLLQCCWRCPPPIWPTGWANWCWKSARRMERSTCPSTYTPWYVALSVTSTYTPWYVALSVTMSKKM